MDRKVDMVQKEDMAVVDTKVKETATEAMEAMAEGMEDKAVGMVAAHSRAMGMAERVVKPREERKEEKQKGWQQWQQRQLQQQR